MRQQRRQSKQIAESGTGGVLEMANALLPKTRRAPAAAKKPAPAAPVEPEQPQLAREPAAPQTRRNCTACITIMNSMGRDKLYSLMRQQQQKAAAAGREFPCFSHRLIQSWLRQQEMSLPNLPSHQKQQQHSEGAIQTNGHGRRLPVVQRDCAAL
jgi:hypothetical protein